MEWTNILKPFLITSILNILVTFTSYNIWWFEIALLITLILSTGFIIMGITWIENVITQAHNKDHK